MSSEGLQLTMNNLQQYNQMASTWWNESSPFKDLLYLNEPRFRFFEKHVSSWKGKRVLDLGCGGGFVSEELARRGASVVGVDPASALLDVARAHARESDLAIDYCVGTGESIPAQDSEFDIVVCVDVLEHVADLDKVLIEVRRVLKPGGLFLYDTINKNTFSFLWMIVALEWISGRIPRGTHDWRKFIKPETLHLKLTEKSFLPLEQNGVGLGSLAVSKWKILPKFKLSKQNMIGLYVGVAQRT